MMSFVCVWTRVVPCHPHMKDHQQAMRHAVLIRTKAASCSHVNSNRETQQHTAGRGCRRSCHAMRWSICRANMPPTLVSTNHLFWLLHMSFPHIQDMKTRFTICSLCEQVQWTNSKAERVQNLNESIQMRLPYFLRHFYIFCLSDNYSKVIRHTVNCRLQQTIDYNR